jgi:PTS system nitrogen regulatory IIA component
LITSAKTDTGSNPGPGAFGCADLITSDCVLANLKASNKKQVLQELARKAAKLTGQDEGAIFETLSERERLGTTGIGHGIAIPHGKLPGLDRVYGVFAKLERPVDFDAIDDQPVDLIFLLLAPANCGADHLKALAKVSRMLRDRILCEKMRGSTTCDAIYSLMMNQTESRDAA